MNEPQVLVSGDANYIAGAAQIDRRDEVNLGWNTSPTEIPNPLIGGIENEEIWALIRRFNSQIFRIKQTSTTHINGLDFHVSEDEEFSPDKLRSQFERLYMGMIIGIIASYKHIARLRSWKESRRTGAFCTIYFVAWAVDRLVFVLLALLVTITVSPTARRVLFPPAPIALVDHSTGGATRPAAGILGSTDTATGAPENQKGEALENEASNFATGIGAIALNIMTAGDPHGEAETDGESLGDSMPPPNTVATVVATAKDKSKGVDRPSDDKTKAPMEHMLWAQMRPLMHLMSVTSDTWERCANVLSPMAPFDQGLWRLRAAGLAIPLVTTSWVITANIVFQTVTLVIGVMTFGHPVLNAACNFLDRYAPAWKHVLDINHTLLRGIPTDAQLAITFLRLGEAHKAPLPPPPVVGKAPPEQPLELSDDVLSATGGDQPLAATQDELYEAAAHHATTNDEAGGENNEMTSTTTDSKKRSKFLGFFKGALKGGVKLSIAADKIRAKTGIESAKQRVGVVPAKGYVPFSGPVKFDARYHGQQGHVYLNLKGGVPCTSFRVDTKSAMERVGQANQESSREIWSVAVDDVKVLEKHSGYGFKFKLLAGWALDRQLSDSLEILDIMDNSYVLTAIPQRDELFNRLCAIGAQKWEVW